MENSKNIEGGLVISGGGIAGLTLALLMAGIGLDVHVIDPIDPQQLKEPKVSGRTVALMNSSLNIIRATGVKSPESLGNPLQMMRIIDKSIAEQKNDTHDFEAGDIGLEQFGYNIPNNALHHALFKIAQDHKNITLHCPAKLEHFEISSGSCIVTLDNGLEIKSPLLVGADGRNSAVRALAGIKAEERAYGQSAMTFIINHSQSHENIATEFHYTSGPLALVPLPGNQSSVVWVEKTTRAEDLIRLKKQELENIFNDKTDMILGGATLETGVESWPLCSIKAQKLTAPHVALIAEAAHVMSPITAQGLNLSLRDVATLAEILADGVRAGLSLGDPALLAQYERRRSFDYQTRTLGVDSMMRLVSNNIMPLKAARRTGFKMLDAISPLKNFAMRHGLAPTLDQGRLAQGERL